MSGKCLVNPPVDLHFTVRKKPGGIQVIGKTSRNSVPPIPTRPLAFYFHCLSVSLLARNVMYEAIACEGTGRDGEFDASAGFSFPNTRHDPVSSPDGQRGLKQRAMEENK